MSLQDRWSLLLGSTLETLAHQILYVRHVYPRDTFGATQFLGVRCHVNRHPGVVRYIRDSVALAVPALRAGAASEVRIVICEADELGETCQELETYRLKLSGLAEELDGFGLDADADDTGGAADKAGDGDDGIQNAVENGERAVRDLMIRVLGMESESSSRSDSLSFRILIHVAEEDASCPELDRAVATGSWVSGDESASESKGLMIRPLYQSSSVFGTVSLQQLVRSSRKPRPAGSAAQGDSHGCDVKL